MILLPWRAEDLIFPEIGVEKGASAKAVCTQEFLCTSLLIFPPFGSRMWHPASFPGCQDIVGPFPSVFRDKHCKYTIVQATFWCLGDYFCLIP
jgi:hypothetical protein